MQGIGPPGVNVFLGPTIFEDSENISLGVSPLPSPVLQSQTSPDGVLIAWMDGNDGTIATGIAHEVGHY